MQGLSYCKISMLISFPILLSSFTKEFGEIGMDSKKRNNNYYQSGNDTWKHAVVVLKTFYLNSLIVHLMCVILSKGAILSQKVISLTYTNIYNQKAIEENQSMNYFPLGNQCWTV